MADNIKAGIVYAITRPSNVQKSVASRLVGDNRARKGTLREAERNKIVSHRYVTHLHLEVRIMNAVYMSSSSSFDDPYNPDLLFYLD